MSPSDFNYVISAWLKSFKYSGTTVQRMRDTVYFATYEPIVKRLIKQSDVYVACLREEPEVIVGYLAIERKHDSDIIHFVQVKDLWQKMGVATYLLEAAKPATTTYFTHWTNPIDSLVNKYPFIFNPFLSFNKE